MYEGDGGSAGPSVPASDVPASDVTASDVPEPAEESSVGSVIPETLWPSVRFFIVSSMRLSSALSIAGGTTDGPGPVKGSFSIPSEKRKTAPQTSRKNAAAAVLDIMFLSMTLFFK